MTTVWLRVFRFRYSPGGITEMTLLALSLGYDGAFVATHHVIRISCLVLCVPWLFRLSAPR